MNRIEASLAVAAVENVAAGISKVAPEVFDGTISLKNLIAKTPQSQNLERILPDAVLSMDRIPLGSKTVLDDGSKFMVAPDGTFASTYREWIPRGISSHWQAGIAVVSPNGKEVGKFITGDNHQGRRIFDWIEVAGDGHNIPAKAFADQGIFSAANPRSIVKEMKTLYPGRDPYERSREFFIKTSAGFAEGRSYYYSAEPSFRDIFTRELPRNFPDDFLQRTAANLLETKNRLLDHARALEKVGK